MQEITEICKKITDILRITGYLMSYIHVYRSREI